MRKLIVVGVSAVVLALGAAQASAATCHGSPCSFSSASVGQACVVPAGAEGQVAPTQLLSQRKN